MLRPGTRVKLNPRSSYRGQNKEKGIEYMGTIMKNKDGEYHPDLSDEERHKIYNFTYLVRWDFEKRSHLLYNDSDLIVAGCNNNEEALQFLVQGELL